MTFSKWFSSSHTTLKGKEYLLMDVEHCVEEIIKVELLSSESSV